MGEITKGKKTDEIFLDDPTIKTDQETCFDDPDREDTNKEGNSQVEDAMKLEEPPTYRALEETATAREDVEETWEIPQKPDLEQSICGNCGASLRKEDRFCPYCGVKSGRTDADTIAATDERQQTADSAGKTQGQEPEPSEYASQAQENSQVPRIRAEEIQKSVEEEAEKLQNLTDQDREKLQSQTEAEKSDTPEETSKEQEPLHYTEEERRQQVLRMAQQDINYEQQLEKLAGEPEEKKPKKKRKAWKIVLGTVGSLVVLAAAGVYAAGVYHFQDRFFLNTTINGIDVSEDTVENFKKRVGDEIAKYQIAVKERDGVTEYLTSADLGYGYTPSGEIEQLKSYQNPFLWPECLFTTYLYSCKTSVAYSEESLEQSVKNMAGFKEENVVQPENAYVSYNGETYEVVPEVEGNLLDEEHAIALVKNAVDTGASEISFEDSGCYVEPARRQDDAAMNAAVNQLNTYLSTNIEYIFGANREVLDASLIKDWISFDETTFEVYFDDEKLTQYVAQLAEKYDTYNKDRQFTTNDGSVVTVSGGSGYGWMIDQEAEVQEVKQWITEGTQNIRYANFAREAVSWDNCDLGDSYIEIDLTRQHVWLYIDGKEIVSTDCVTGDMTIAGRVTPGGTYTLYYKESPSILKGEGYEDGVEVQYWMPFNDGIGLHDASWRTEFGGQIYISNGSHGCVNLPSDQAKMIYDNIYAGIPIICYYR